VAHSGACKKDGPVKRSSAASGNERGDRDREASPGTRRQRLLSRGFHRAAAGLLQDRRRSGPLAICARLVSFAPPDGRMPRDRVRCRYEGLEVDGAPPRTLPQTPTMPFPSRLNLHISCREAARSSRIRIAPVRFRAGSMSPVLHDAARDLDYGLLVIAERRLKRPSDLDCRRGSRGES